MNTEFLKILHCITAFQLFFFAFIAFSLAAKKKYNYWLAAFLFIKASHITLIIIRWHYNLMPSNYLYHSLTYIFEYSLCPVFYIYVVKISQQKIKFTPIKLLFLIPIIIGFIFLHMPQPYWSKYWQFFNPFLTFNYYSQAIIYTLLAFKHYKSFQSDMNNHLTQNAIQKLNWLKLIILGYALLWITSFMANIINWAQGGDFTLFDIVIEIIFLAFINILLFIGTRLPKGIHELSSDSVTNTKTNIVNKYASSALTINDKNAIVEKLSIIMQTSKLYKTPNLTLKNLASEISVQSKHLSQVINENYNQNFCEYINTLRIEDAKNQLSNPKNDYKTILEIIYDTGFNSKSVFNTIFKKQTGVTPSYFRSESKLKHSQKHSKVESLVN